MLAVEVAEGELVARVLVEVDEEPLTGVEQLDQEGGVGAEACHVVGPQVAEGIGEHGVTQDRAVRQPAEPCAAAAEDLGGGTDEVLGEYSDGCGIPRKRAITAPPR